MSAPDSLSRWLRRSLRRRRRRQRRLPPRASPRPAELASQGRITCGRDVGDRFRVPAYLAYRRDQQIRPSEAYLRQPVHHSSRRCCSYLTRPSRTARWDPSRLVARYPLAVSTTGARAAPAARQATTAPSRPAQPLPRGIEDTGARVSSAGWISRHPEGWFVSRGTIRQCGCGNSTGATLPPRPGR